ncbi:hypothetical protein CV093_08085 [Oceanobacillus sp. 143]|nr:hypothetical protein CV093_08085 [Oceanobacillus sp. 143]
MGYILPIEMYQYSDYQKRISAEKEKLVQSTAHLKWFWKRNIKKLLISLIERLQVRIKPSASNTR